MLNELCPTLQELVMPQILVLRILITAASTAIFAWGLCNSSCLKPVLAPHGERVLLRSVLPLPEDPCQKILKK